MLSPLKFFRLQVFRKSIASFHDICSPNLQSVLCRKAPQCWTNIAGNTMLFEHVQQGRFETTSSRITQLDELVKLINSRHDCFSSDTMNRQEFFARALWRSADAVCFDVDSTVCVDEAIDELAKFARREKEVADLTQKAMRGGMTFREALAQRLELIQPTVPMVQDYLVTHEPCLTPGIRDLVTTLHSRSVPVYLVSGGFDTIIEPVAEELDIPYQNIFANRLKFYFSGEYAGFDENQPTCDQDGKAQVAAYLKHRYGYQRLVMVGDGVTDLVASPPADLFIGFGGNQVRERVKKEAKWFVTSFDELTEELNHN